MGYFFRPRGADGKYPRGDGNHISPIKSNSIPHTAAVAGARDRTNQQKIKYGITVNPAADRR